MNAPLPIAVRPTEPGDIPALTAIINAIIAIGGTTAYEEPFGTADLERKLLTGPNCLCSHTAIDRRDGSPAGFQYMALNPALPANWGDIATFARPAPKLPGVGTALFAATLAFAGAHGLVAINATIRADNTSGLAYYARMGFADYDVIKSVPLRDGTQVDRIMKRFDL